MFKKRSVSVLIAIIMAFTLSTGMAFATEPEQEKATLPTSDAADLVDKIAPVKDGSSWADVQAANAKRLFGDTDFMRICGPNRYDTAIASANALKNSLGVDKFDTIIVASGETYPDALTGSYLAFIADAPILLVNGGDTTQDKVLDYIKNNLNQDGNVYLLGGEGAVSKTFERNVKKIAYAERLGGKTRYETNLAILDKIEGDETAVLVCSGNGFADSLSVSAIGLPILLVGDQLTAEQKQYLNDKNVKYSFIIGGTGAVNTAVERQCKVYTEASARIAGATRYETSANVADIFFVDEDNPESNADYAVLAYAQNFPDGLSAGPLAAEIGAPLLLVDNNSYQAAASVSASVGIKKVAVLGGNTLISDYVAKTMINK